MIRVWTRRDGFCIRIRGHAMTAPHGEDIVCAAVSALSIHTANAMTEIVGLTEGQIRLTVSDGHFDLAVREASLTKRQYRDTLLIFQAFQLSMRELANEYGSAVHYQEGGVWNGKNAITTIRQQKGSRKF